MSTGSDDIVAIGGNLEPETLIRAYESGVFPWPTDGLPLLWFCPRERAVLEFRSMHVSRSLTRARRRLPFRCTIDRSFDAVIQHCAEIPRADQDGTWITPEMIDGYRELHRRGIAHSIEVWDGARLVGGVYGVDAGGAFAAESMFHLESYASKIALLHLIDHLEGRGLEWLDIQVMTPHMEKMGAIEISRNDFLGRLDQEQSRGRVLFPPVVT